MGRNTRAGDIDEMFQKEKSYRKYMIAHVAPIKFWVEGRGERQWCTNDTQ